MPRKTPPLGKFSLSPPDILGNLPSTAIPKQGESREKRMIPVARFGRPIGTGGDIWVWSLSGQARNLRKYNRFFLEDHREVRLRFGKTGGDARKLRARPLLADSGEHPPQDQREAAAALTNRFLRVARSDMPELPDDEVYIADLIGLRVLSPDGQELGSIIGSDDFGAGTLLMIEIEDEPSKTSVGVASQDTTPKDTSGKRVEYVPLVADAITLLKINKTDTALLDALWCEYLGFPTTGSEKNGQDT